MRWPDVRRHARQTPLAIAFTDPQTAMVGLRHDQLPAGAHAVLEAGLRTVLLDFAAKLRVLGQCRPEDTAKPQGS